MAHFARFDVMGIRGFTREPGIKIIQTPILFIALSAFGISNSGVNSRSSPEWDRNFSAFDSIL